MKGLKFLLAGIVFGITLTKGEVVSWYRIYEMFRFESFHMYGVIGSAVVLGIIVVFLIKRSQLKSTEGQEIGFSDKELSYPRYLIGGTIFGLGWAMAGACPGPMVILLGNGFLVFLAVIASAIFGTFVYGLVREKIPH